MHAQPQLISLIEAVKNGDQQAFESLYLETLPVLRTVCRRYLSDANEIEDAIQESFVKIYKSLPDLNDPGAFLSWSRMIAQNTCLNIIRSRNLMRSREEMRPMYSDDESKGLEDIPAEDYRRECDPEFVMESALRASIVRQILSSLTDTQRSCILLWSEGFTYKAIAQRLGMPVGSAKSTVFYAKRKVTEAVKEVERTKNIRLHMAPIPFFLFLLSMPDEENALLSGTGNTVSELVSLENAAGFAGSALAAENLAGQGVLSKGIADRLHSHVTSIAAAAALFFAFLLPVWSAFVFPIGGRISQYSAAVTNEAVHTFHISELSSGRRAGKTAESAGTGAERRNGDISQLAENAAAEMSESTASGEGIFKTQAFRADMVMRIHASNTEIRDMDDGEWENRNGAPNEAGYSNRKANNSGKNDKPGQNERVYYITNSSENEKPADGQPAATASETGNKEQITVIPNASPTEMPENRKDSPDKDEEPTDNSGRSDKNKVGNGEPEDREEKKSDDADPVPGNSKSGDETDAAPDDAGSEEDADPGEDDGSDREGRNGNGSEEDKNDSGNRKDDKKSDDSDHRKKDDENESGMSEDREPTEAAETEAPTPSPSETPQRPADNTPRTPTTVPTATPSPTETPTPRPTETQPLTIPVQRISIADSFAHTNVVNYVLNAGESYKIPLTVYPANATEKITWRASGGGVRIDDNGVVTNPGYAGVVDITAQSGNVSAKATMILTNVSEASSGQCGDEVYWEVSGNTLHFYGKGDMWPDKGGDRMLTNPWLSHANEITKVKIDAGITSIEHSAFYALYRVSEVRIPKGVTKLGDWVFVWCRAGVIHLPNTLHYVADSAIWGINTFYPEIVFHGTWEEWDAIDKNGKIRNCQVTFVEE